MVLTTLLGYNKGMIKNKDTVATCSTLYLTDPLKRICQPYIFGTV
jgi:hypothetical protein